MGKSSTTKSFNGFQDEEMNFGFEKKNEDNNEDNISLDLKYRHGLTGKELSRRAKELKKRQNREREQRRDNKTQNYNYAREMQQLSHSVPVEILKNAQNVENSDFNSATMTMMTPTTDGDMNSAYQQSMSVGASASSFGNNHSSPAGQQATKYYYSMSPASANKNMMSRSLENNFGELGSPNADDGFGLRQMLLSPTKFKANRRELRRLFGKLEFESMDKSSLERVFCIVEIGKKSSKTVQLSEFLETENAPYHAIRRVERNVMNSDTGIASVEVLWDVKDRNYASPPPPAAPSSRPSRQTAQTASRIHRRPRAPTATRRLMSSRRRRRSESRPQQYSACRRPAEARAASAGAAPGCPRTSGTPRTPRGRSNTC